MHIARKNTGSSQSFDTGPRSAHLPAGAPPVSAPQQRGFGTVVMEAMTERSLNGKVELLYLPSGVTWHLSCPAAGALESGWG
jgi:hypothetical protein